MTRNVDELRGATRLAVEATRGITDLVEEMHLNIGGGPALLGRPTEGATRLFSGLVYRSIRGVTEVVGAGLDLALSKLTPLVEDGKIGPEREAVLAALNGVLGDYLKETNNPLAIEMQLRQGGERLTLERAALREKLPQAGGKLLLLVHGSAMGDRQWLRLGHDHGAALARELGYTPLYLYYNSGLHISETGRAFAGLLEQLVAAWPVPVEELTIVGHSMGGLVARSACHVGELEGQSWRGKLRKLVCLGSPHHGAHLERAGNWVDMLLGATRYSAPLARLGKIRSAGVTDLRFGNVLDEDWRGRDRFAFGSDARTPLPLPSGVACYAIAATTSPKLKERLPGDGLVTVASALGRHRDPQRTLAFPESRQFIGLGMRHLDLLSRAEIYATLRGWLA